MKRKTVVIGVTGGIAVYKALDVVSRLKKRKLDVHVIMTKSAKEFVTPLSFQSLSNNAVIHDMFEEPKVFEIQHISLAQKADLFLVVPATANIIGKVSNGIADDMLSTTIMATKAPVVFVTAMNTNMYENRIVQDNIKKLKEYGYYFIDPACGRLACGDVGRGKLEDTAVIEDYVVSMLHDNKELVGKKVLISAGPTISKIDPVRYLTNYSSGKMGYALAKEARDRGAEVTLVSGASLPDINNIRTIKVKTTKEMRVAMVKEYEDSDIVIKAAAVSDYKIEEYSEEKIKKSSEKISFNFVKDIDILKELGEKKTHQLLVGFAAESNDVFKYGKEKLIKKNLDFIVVNDITHKDSGFNSDFNRISIISKDGEEISFDKEDKNTLASEIFNTILKKR